MLSRPPRALGVLVIGCLVVGLVAISGARAATPQVDQFPNFPVTLQGDRVQFGSPTVADITGDGRPEIIVGGKDGVIHAANRDGRILWQFRTDDAFNNVPGIANRSATTIRSVPAVGDLDGDGIVEIVVSVGDIPAFKQNGGVVVLRNNGTLYPGWPQLADDHIGGAPGSDGKDGYTDGVVASPSIGDVTGDGKPEIVYGGFDHLVYVKNPNGSNVAGWPRFVRDTSWSSPALGDLNRDGRDDIIIGVDGHVDPLFDDQDGGYVHAINIDGGDLPGWRRYQDDVAYSAPAIADLDKDGSFEVIIAAGGYYASRTGEPRGRYVTAHRSDGSTLWRATADAVISSSPAIGDVNGDQSLDVVVGVENGQVMAVNGKDGNKLWTVSVPSASFVFKSPVLGDYDGDGLDDVFVTQGFDVVPLKGTNGNRLAEPYTFTGNYSLDNTAALGDLNGDGKLEIIAAAGTRDTDVGRAQIYAWSLPNSTTKASWPVFRGDPAHTARIGRVVPQQPPTATTAPTATTPPAATATIASTTVNSPTVVSSPTGTGATATSTATGGTGGTATATTTSEVNFRVYLPFVATSGSSQPIGTLTPTGTLTVATATQSTPTMTGTAATPTAAGTTATTITGTAVTATITGTATTPTQTVTGTPPTGTPTAASTATAGPTATTTPSALH